jgi:hypothetical protein
MSTRAMDTTQANVSILEWLRERAKTPPCDCCAARCSQKLEMLQEQGRCKERQEPDDPKEEGKGLMVPRAALEWAVLEAVACELEWRCRVGPGRCLGAETCDRVRGSESCVASLCEAAIREGGKGS